MIFWNSAATPAGTTSTVCVIPLAYVRVIDFNVCVGVGGVGGGGGGPTFGGGNEAITDAGISLLVAAFQDAARSTI